MLCIFFHDLFICFEPFFLNHPSKLVSLWFTLYLVDYFGMHLCNHVGYLSHFLLTSSSSFRGLNFIHVTHFKYFQLIFLWLIALNPICLLLRSQFWVFLVHSNLSTMIPIRFVFPCLHFWLTWSWYPYTLILWFFEWYFISIHHDDTLGATLFFLLT